MKLNRHELGSGLFFVAVGTFFAAVALRTLPMGTATNMGPGYFPAGLAFLTIAIGVVVMVRSVSTEPFSDMTRISWRSVVALPVAIIAFALLISRVGMAPTVFITALIASMAAKQARPLRLVVTCAAIAVVSTIIFGYLLGLPIPAFRYPF